MKARDFRTKARVALNGFWGVAIAVTLVASFLGGTIASTSGAAMTAGVTGGTSSAVVKNETEKNTADGSEVIITDEESERAAMQAQLVSELVDSLTNDQAAVVGMVFIVLVAVVLAIAAISLLIAGVKVVLGGAVRLGLATFNLKLVDGKEDANFGDLFSRMYIGKGFMLSFLEGVYVFLWTLLLIVPGIMKAFGYAMAPYILAENPELSADEALRRSSAMMKGHRWQYFCLLMSFIGWEMLCALTLGIGMLWVNPYKEAASAAFYREVSGTAVVETPALEAENEVPASVVEG